MGRKPVVYVPNRGAHDYEDAKQYGELVFLTSGVVERYRTNTIYRELMVGMADAQADDYLLVSSLSILNSIISGILARQFGKINFLLFRDGKYLLRTVNIDSLLPTTNQEGEEAMMRFDGENGDDNGGNGEEESTETETETETEGEGEGEGESETEAEGEGETEQSEEE